MILSFWRSLLLAGGGLAVLAHLSYAADVAFTTYAFLSADGTTARTLPARLAETTNVKDYGAKGDGVTDDWAAITAAYNHGQVTLVATAPSSGSTITFASVPGTIKSGMYAVDVTNPGAFAGGNPGVSVDFPPTATTVTLNFITGIVQAGDVISFRPTNKGTIFFPAGTYLVSQSIVMEATGFNIVGVGDASVITGNFSDFIFRRLDADSIPNGPISSIEALKVVNTHATGGGIQIGNCTLGAVRDCTVVANKGIQIAADGTPAPASGPLDMSVENCSVSPGANPSGSIGIMSLANGPIYNCRIIGYESGMRLYGNEGNQDVLGCYLEGNLVALDLGKSPDGTSTNSSGLFVSGCWFKNNGTAIKNLGIVAGLFSGLRIEASEAVTVFGARPQYGIRISDDKNNLCLYAGITITGQYDQYGVLFGQDGNLSNTWMGVQVVNTSTHGGLAWGLPASPTSMTAKFVGCNVSPVFTVAALPSATKFEGDCYNVSNSNSSTWGATPSGGGSTHAKVRWSGSAWAVVGI